MVVPGLGRTWGAPGATTSKGLLTVNSFFGHWPILAPFGGPQNGPKSDKNQCLFWEHFLCPKLINFGIKSGSFWDTCLIKSGEKSKNEKMVIFAPRLSEKLIFDGQRALKVRKSHIFPMLKSCPDLGTTFRSILTRFGSHIGSILEIKTMSKNSVKNRDPKNSLFENFGPAVEP